MTINEDSDKSPVSPHFANQVENCCAPFHEVDKAEEDKPAKTEDVGAAEIDSGVSETPFQCEACGDDQVEETIKVRAHSRITLPSKEEIRRHKLTHIPYRSWCPICVAAKKKNPPHYARAKQPEDDIPIISMDYMYLNQCDDLEKNPIMVVKDHHRGGVWAFMVLRKGSY